MRSAMLFVLIMVIIPFSAFGQTETWRLDFANLNWIASDGPTRLYAFTPLGPGYDVRSIARIDVATGAILWERQLHAGPVYSPFIRAAAGRVTISYITRLEDAEPADTMHLVSFSSDGVLLWAKTFLRTFSWNNDRDGNVYQFFGADSLTKFDPDGASKWEAVVPGIRLMAHNFITDDDRNCWFFLPETQEAVKNNSRKTTMIWRAWKINGSTGQILFNKPVHKYVSESEKQAGDKYEYHAEGIPVEWSRILFADGKILMIDPWVSYTIKRTPDKETVAEEGSIQAIAITKQGKAKRSLYKPRPLVIDDWNEKTIRSEAYIFSCLGLVNNEFFFAGYASRLSPPEADGDQKIMHLDGVVFKYNIAKARVSILRSFPDAHNDMAGQLVYGNSLLVRYRAGERFSWEILNTKGKTIGAISSLDSTGFFIKEQNAGIEPGEEDLYLGFNGGDGQIAHYTLAPGSMEPGVAEHRVSTEVPDFYILEQNFPNPFNPSTTIRYHLPEESMVRLSVSNLLGQEIRVLVNDVEEAGDQVVEFDGSMLPSGVYLYRLDAAVVNNPARRFNRVDKMILLK